MKKILLLVVTLAAFSQITKAQQGFGTSNPAPSSVIDMTATNKGVLLPRVALTSTIVAAPVNAPANALTVFNTATTTTGANDVTPGYYYWSVPEMKWIRLKDASDTSGGNNWNVELTTTPATSNTENIYQNGRVAIGNFAATKPVTNFEVRGSARIGVPHASEVTGPIDGEDPVGRYTLGVGERNLINGNNSFAVGYQNVVNTNGSFAVGESNTVYASAERGYTSGYNNSVRGQDAMAYGTSNEANHVSETVIGRYNAFTLSIGATVQAPNIPLFQVGNGTGTGTSRANALTILQGGDVGIGIAGQNYVAMPTQRLDIGSGNVRIRDIYTEPGTITGATPDKVVVADATGILKTVAASALAGNNWRVENSATPATSNTENIYQNGRVGIFNQNPSTTLDVIGNISVGRLHAPTSAIHTAAFGEQHTITGSGSYSAISSGRQNFINENHGYIGGGYQNSIQPFGSYSAILSGTNNRIESATSTIGGGSDNITKGPSSAIAGGVGNVATSFGEFVAGYHNGIITQGPQHHGTDGQTDPLFQLGNGLTSGLRNNALTVLKNAHTAIGVVGTEAAAKPTELLDLGGSATAGKGGLKIRNINSTAYTGNIITDRVVVADNTGILKTVAASALGTEPWQVQGFTTKATSNTEAIYQNAKVAIGDFSTGGAGGASAKQLEVKGDFKSARTTAGNNSMVLEVNSPLGVEATGGYWLNGNTGQIHAFVADNESVRAVALDNMAATTKASNFEVSVNSVNMYSKHGGEAKQGTLELNGNDGRFSLYANQYSTNVGSMVKSDGANGLLLYHGGSSAATGVVDGYSRAQVTIKKGEGVTISNYDASAALTGIYTLPTTNGSNGQVLTKSTGNTTVWSSPVAEPKFFYAPSMVLPTNSTGLPAGVTYSGGTFTVDLHTIYSNQFGMAGAAGPVAGRTAIKSPMATTLPVKTAAQLEYFVTYFDNTVYDPSSITLSDAGILTYQILPAATVTDKTYMNIVFKVK